MAKQRSDFSRRTRRYAVWIAACGFLGAAIIAASALAGDDMSPSSVVLAIVAAYFGVIGVFTFLWERADSTELRTEAERRKDRVDAAIHQLSNALTTINLIEADIRRGEEQARELETQIAKSAELAKVTQEEASAVLGLVESRQWSMRAVVLAAGVNLATGLLFFLVGLWVS